MAGNAREPAIFAHELLAKLRQFIVDSWFCGRLWRITVKCGHAFGNQMSSRFESRHTRLQPRLASWMRFRPRFVGNFTSNKFSRPFGFEFPAENFELRQSLRLSM